jgi:PAS domain S-box-containing protein
MRRDIVHGQNVEDVLDAAILTSEASAAHRLAPRTDKIEDSSEPHASIVNPRQVFAHALCALAFGTLFLLLNRREVIVIARLGSVVWYPATGLAVAFMLMISPGYGVLTAICITVAGILIYDQPLLSWSGTVTAATVAGAFAVATYLLHGPLYIDLGLRQRRDVIRYVSVTTIASLASTLVGTACLAGDHAISWSEYGAGAIHWFLADEISLLGVAPFLIIHVLPWVRRQVSGDRSGAQTEKGSSRQEGLRNLKAWLEAGGQALTGVLVLWVMFGELFGNYQASFLCLIPIVWIAMRQGIRRVVSGLLALNSGIVIALHYSSVTTDMRIEMSLLMMVVSGTGLLVGAAVSERQRITTELAALTLELRQTNTDMQNEVAQRLRSEQLALDLLQREKLSAQQAREERALSDAVIQALPALVTLLDSEGRALRWNTSFETMLGYSTEDITRLRVLDIVAEEDKKWVADNLQQILERGAAECEASLIRKDGTRVSCFLSGVRIVLNGQPCLLSACLDITTLKRAEAELRSQTAFLEAQANSTIDGILVVNQSGQVMLRNRRILEIFKIPSEIFAKNDDQPMLEYVVTLIKDPQAFLARVHYLYDHPNETSRDEIELKDGTILDRYSAPVTDKDGRCYGRIWTFRDVTERRHDEEELRQLSLAVEQSPASILITDTHGKITYVNRRFTQCTGYSPQEAIGSNPRLLKSGYVSEAVYRDLWQTILRGGEWRGELCNKKKNGELYWESATISPVTNAKGSISHFLAIKEDITERRAIEAQLRQAQKLEAVGQLAAGIAHEINTPTQFVTDNLTFLRDASNTVHALLERYRNVIHGLPDAVLPESIRDDLKKADLDADLEFLTHEAPRAIDQALEGAGRVAKIVRAMKEFSHPDSTEKAPADLNRAIETTITVARNEWKYYADLETHLDPELPPVPCHLSEVNQVILNLVVNAAHTIKDKIGEGEKGKITITTSDKGDCAEIAIADTGMGIPESIHSRVFDPFFTTKEVGKGTGQGLSLAYSVIVKKHAGKIWFETEPGRGTTFFLQLPF